MTLALWTIPFSIPIRQQHIQHIHLIRNQQVCIGKNSLADLLLVKAAEQDKGKLLILVSNGEGGGD